MTDTPSNRKKDIICGCSGTTAERIKTLIDEGVDDLDSISRRTGACSGCGACDVDILALLAEYRVTEISHRSCLRGKSYPT